MFGPTVGQVPASLPPSWTSHLDEGSGLTYFYNTSTGVSGACPPLNSSKLMLAFHR